MKKITQISKIAALLIGLFFGTTSYAQVGIGTIFPDTNSLLELNSTVAVPGGLRLPRLALTNTTTTTPLSAHLQGMFVYNTTNNAFVTEGIYYNNGFAWIRVANGTVTNDWALAGNTIAAADFLGTINALDLNIRTTNLPRMRVQANGQVTVNYGAAAAGAGDNFASFGTYAVNGYTTNGFGVYGQATTGLGVYGFATGNGDGVWGDATTGDGVFGLTDSSNGVYGLAFTSGIGVRGESNTNIASLGISTSGVGVQGQSTTSSGVVGLGAVYGIAGQITNATGIGAFGVATTSGRGVQGQSGTGDGVLGFSGGAGDGVYGQSATGNGVFGYTNSAADAIHAEQDGNGNAVDAVNYGNGAGVYGENFFFTAPSISAVDGSVAINAIHNFGGDAIVSQTTSTISNALWALNPNATGTAVLGSSNNLSVYSPATGSGVAGSGSKNGIFGYAGVGANAIANYGNAAGLFTLDTDSNPTTNGTNNGTRANARIAGFDNISPNGALGAQTSYFGGYFSGGNVSTTAGNTPSYAYAGIKYNADVNGRGGTNYKIIGNGTVSTLIKDSNNVPRIMFAPEAPEILFEDYGTGKLVNGTAQIAIDPILKKSIFVDENHPLKVFIQLEGDCNGVYVTNKSENGFTVKELANGSSNVSFSWHLVANRADEIGPNGEIASKHVGLRLPIGPGPLTEPEFAVRKEGDNKAGKNLSAKTKPERKEKTIGKVDETIKEVKALEKTRDIKVENEGEVKENIEEVTKKVRTVKDSKEKE